MSHDEPTRGRPSRRAVLVGAIVPVVAGTAFGASRLAAAAPGAAATAGSAAAAGAKQAPAPRPPEASGPVTDAAEHGVLPGRNVSAALGALLARTAARGGGIVALKRAGTYRVESCTLASGTTLRLGRGVRLQLPTGSTARAMLLLPPRGRDVVVEGPGVLDGNRDGYHGDTVNEGDILYAADEGGPVVRGLRVDGVRFTRAPRSGINTGRGVSNVLITGCSFDRMTRHAVISYNGRHVRWVANRASRAADVIAANTPTFQYWVNPGQRVAGPLVQRNRIVGRRGTGGENAFIGIELHADGTGRLLGALVEGNVVRNGSMGVSLAGCDDVVVRRNTVVGTDYCGFEVASGRRSRIDRNHYDGRGRGSGVRLNDRPAAVQVTGNTIANWADEFANAAVHCNAERLVGGAISGNHLRGASSRASVLYLANASGLTIAKNDIAVRATGEGLHYIDLRAQSSDSSRNRILNNVVTGTTGAYWTNGMVSIAAADGRTAAHNTVSGNSLTLPAGGSGLGVALTAEGSGAVSDTRLSGNRLRGPFTERLRRRRAPGTIVS